MKIVGCDFHPGWQQVAVFDDVTAEIEELKLSNGSDAAFFTSNKHLRRSHLVSRVIAQIFVWACLTAY